MRLFFIALFTILFCVGCGKNSNQVPVTIDIGVPVYQKTFHNLSNEAFRYMITPSGPCRQKYFFSGLKPENGTGGNGPVIGTQPVLLDTTLASSAGAWGNSESNALAGINSAYLEAPVVITVPSGQLTGIGMIGAIYEPHQNNGGAFCDETLSDGTELYSYSVSGHVDVNVTSATTIPLNLWLVYAATPNVLHACSDPTNDQTCSKKNFVTINRQPAYTGSNCPSYIGTTVKVNYLLPSSPSTITQTFNSTSITSTLNVTVPQLDQYEIDYTYAGTAVSDFFTNNNSTGTSAFAVSTTNTIAVNGCFIINPITVP